jgi:putative beta-lysine N-acetyltransferase
MNEINTYYVNEIIEGHDYTIDVCLDFYNDRLKVDDYRGNITSIIKRMNKLIGTNSFSKIFLKARQEDWITFLNSGYILEGVFSDYFNGSDALSMAFYYERDRRTSDYWIVEDETLLQILELPKKGSLPPTPEGYTIRRADNNDAKALSELYSTVFEVYPTPMNEPSYIRSLIDSNSIFYLAEKAGVLESAASADLNRTYHNAEITDCATLKTSRKHGLMKHLIARLEKELLNEKIFCVYSIARALSFGMNAAFHQRSYRYTGRLIKNCKIYNKFEDMNIWVKNLAENSAQR